MQRFNAGSIFLALGWLVGCATPTVVETKKAGDADLSCTQIKAELVEADKYLQAAKKERTVTGTNVVAAVFFWPALLGTYANTEEAINAAKERENVLKNLGQRKKCDLESVEAAPVPTSAVVRTPAVNVTPLITQTVPSSAGQLIAQPANLESTFKPLEAKEIQQHLLGLGYAVGKPDGMMGKRSIDALKKFQLDSGLTQTGQINPETQNKLLAKSGVVSK